ncbi:MAG: nitroreductase family protein [Bacilli bacterium]
MNETIYNILKRESCRSFENKKVSREDMESIVRCGVWAPISKNVEPSRFTVISNEELIAGISKATIDAITVDEQTAIKFSNYIELINNGLTDIFYGSRNIVIISNEKDSINHKYDAGCAVENMLLAAQSLEIASCFVRELAEVPTIPILREIIERLGIPQNHKVDAIIAFGYADKNLPKYERNRDSTEVKLFD